MNKQYYNQKPLPVETVRSAGGTMTTVIRLDIGAAERNESEPDRRWQCLEAEISHTEPLGEKDYGRVVSALIRTRYSADDVEAIQLNYMASDSVEAAREMAELQQWRTDCKRMARMATGLADEE